MRVLSHGGKVCLVLALGVFLGSASYGGSNQKRNNQNNNTTDRVGTNVAALNIMFYNVYNLFDAVHDQGKEDWTFLPKNFPGKNEYCATISNPNYKEECEKSDWTEEHVRLKLNQIKTAVSAATETLPDMMGLCEVENPNIVGRLAEKLGYQNFVMTNSPDERGIDVALLYNLESGLKMVRKAEHVVSMGIGDGGRPTRNVLEVEFQVNQLTRLIVFVNHWPSQALPSVARYNVARQVRDIIDQRLKSNPQANIVMMGDFNTVNQDYPHPFHSVIMADGKNALIDSFDLLMESRQIDQSIKKKMPTGSYFYPPKMSWDRLDRIFVNKNLVDNHDLEVDEASFRILNPVVITDTYKYENAEYFNYGTVVTHTPNRPNIFTLDPNEAGFSDHFPVLVKLLVK